MLSFKREDIPVYLLITLTYKHLKETFSFKKFKIDQERCAMKIGTDGVLLGAWSSVTQNPGSILDIGAGTGLVSLMLSQRSAAEVIDAIEIDADAYEQCMENFEASPWGDRLFCYHAGLDEFMDEIDEKYDLIVSNPPFYTENVSSGDVSRDNARQNSSLPFDELLRGVDVLISKNGRFSTIIPFKEENAFITIAKSLNLFPERIVRIKGTANAPFKRSLLEFTRVVSKVLVDELIIEKERHVYTEDYINLTQDFYLKM